MITVYAIRNADGLWLRSLGTWSASEWTEHFTAAKCYQRLSVARAMVTRVTREIGYAPDLIAIEGEGRVVDEGERVNKAVARIERDTADFAELTRKANLRRAREQRDELDRRIEELGGQQ